ncbi:MAG: FtsH protease activity modulator HflK, partial [Elusimicrobiota bacterium]
TRAYKVRFGKFVRNNIQPGLLVKFPYPFERLFIIKPDSIYRMEVGFRSRIPKPGEIIEKRPNVWETVHTGLITRLPEEAICMTGDEYLVDFNIIVHYKVKDIYRYYFTLENTEELVRNYTLDLARDFLCQHHLDNILTLDRDTLEIQIRRHLQKQLDALQSGIYITLVCLHDVHPPVEVVYAFREVASAMEERAMMINEAYGYRNYEIPMARGMAVKLISNEERDKISKINIASGEAQNFKERVKEYKKAPHVTATRLYLERMEEVLKDSEKIIAEEKARLDIKQLMIFRKFLESNVIPSRESD